MCQRQRRLPNTPRIVSLVSNLMDFPLSLLLYKEGEKGSLKISFFTFDNTFWHVILNLEV